MLKQTYYCNISSVDGLALIRLVEFICGKKTIVLEGLKVGKKSATEVEVQPGRALVIYPLVLIENTKTEIVDITQLDSSATRNGYHILGIKYDRIPEFAIITQISDTEWKTSFDDFVVLAILKVENGEITEIRKNYSNWTRHEYVDASGISSALGLVKTDENDPETGYLIDKVDNAILKVDTDDHKVFVNTSAIFLSSLGDVEVAQINTGQILEWNGLKWVNTSLVDEKVKTKPDDPTAGYLIDKLDNTTLIVNDDNKVTVNPSAISISQLLDVDSNLSPGLNDVLYWNGSVWTSTNIENLVNGKVRLTESDTLDYLANKVDNEILKVDSNRLIVDTSSIFLKDLGDVSITSVKQDEVLAWNGTVWTNRPQGKVRLDASDKLTYLESKLDKTTLDVNDNNKIHVVPNSIPLKDIADVDNELSPEVDDILKWDGTRWIATRLIIKDELVKVDTDDIAGYLQEKIDNVYLVVNKDKKVTVDTSQIQLTRLGDVSITNPEEGQHLIWNGSVWTNQTWKDRFVAIDESDAPSYLKDKIDLETLIIQDGKVVVSNGSLYLNNLGNVDVSDLDVNYILKWDGEKWVSTPFQDQFVKATANDTPGYLSQKVDNTTIQIYQNKLRVIPDVFASINHTHTKSDIVNFNEDDYVHKTGNESIYGVKTFEKVVITGNLVIQGSTTTVSSQDLVVNDNVITLNAGETGSGVSKGISGIEIDRGEYTKAKLLFDESDDLWKVDIGNGSLVAISLTGHNHDDRYYTQEQLRTPNEAEVHWGNITNKPEQFPVLPHTHEWSDVSKDGSKLSDISDVPTYQVDSVLYVNENNNLVWKQFTDEKVKVSNSDPTSGYLTDKIDNKTLKISDYKLFVDQSKLFINNHGDVLLNNLEEGNILRWNGSYWINSQERDERVKVNKDDTASGYLQDKIDQYYIIVNNSNKLSLDPTQIRLYDLKDVDITSPSLDDILVWDGSKWVVGQQSKVKIDSSDSSGYLSDKIDNWRIIISEDKKLTVDPLRIKLQELGDVTHETPEVDDTLYWDGTKWVLKRHGDKYVAVDESDTPGYLAAKIDLQTLTVLDNKKVGVKKNSFGLAFLRDVSDSLKPNIGHILVYDGADWISRRVFAEPPMLSPATQVNEHSILTLQILNYDPNCVYTATTSDPDIATAQVIADKVYVTAYGIPKNTSVVLRVIVEKEGYLPTCIERTITVNSISVTYDESVILANNTLTTRSFDYCQNAIEA